MICRLGLPPKDFMETIISLLSNNDAEIYLYLQHIWARDSHWPETDLSYRFLNGTGQDKERMVLQGMRK